MQGKIRLSKSALRLLDLKASAENESEIGASFVPKGISETVMKTHAKELESTIRSQMETGIQFPLPEVLLASKAVRGNRPFAILDITQRVLYNSLTSTLQKELPPLNRSGTLFEEFKLAPLKHSAAGFVVMTDVAACYQYIDHALLASELLAQTSETEISNCVIQFLGALSYGSFSLPQGRYGSHILAELVLDIAERSLLRDGIAIWRYSDDFRIHAGSNAEAKQALERLEHQLRSMGFVLSEEKTSVRSRANYEAWAFAASRHIEAVGGEVELDLTVLDRYEIANPPDIVDVSVEQAVRLLGYWVDGILERKNQFGPDTAINRELFRYALWSLKGLKEDKAISKTKFILEHEPSFTPDIMNYLVEVATLFESEVVEAIDEIVLDSNLFLSDWQKMWLLQPLKQIPNLSSAQVAWVGEQFESKSGAVFAESSIVLANHGIADLDSLLSGFNRCPEASRPQLIEAIAKSASDPSNRKVRAVTRERPLYLWTADAALIP